MYLVHTSKSIYLTFNAQEFLDPQHRNLLHPLLVSAGNFWINLEKRWIKYCVIIISSYPWKSNLHHAFGVRAESGIFSLQIISLLHNPIQNERKKLQWTAVSVYILTWKLCQNCEIIQKSLNYLRTTATYLHLFKN